MLNISYFIALLLITFRLVTFFMVVPVFFPKGVPAQVKIAFSLILATMMIPGLDYSYISLGIMNLNMMNLILLVVNETITGLTLGFLTSLCFYFIRMAGSFMDLQVGFAMLSMFDPSSNSNVTLIERLLYWTSLVLFLLVDGHHMLIRALNESFKIINLGNLILSQDTVMMVIDTFIKFFEIGLKIAIPIVLIIIITDLTLGLVARTVPQLNVMILGLPIKIVVGLGCIVLIMPVLVKIMINNFAKIPHILDEFYKIIPVMIVFASEEKTEQATPKKKSDAKKKGQVAKSKEIGLALTLLASTLIIAGLGEYLLDNLKDTIIYFYTNFLNTQLSYDNLSNLMLIIVMRLGLIILPAALPIMIMGIVSNFIQTGFILTGEPLKPQLSKLNPINGFKKLFSARTIVEMIKDIAIVTAVGYVGFKFLVGNYTKIYTLFDMRIPQIFEEFKSLAVDIFFRVTILMLIIAVADYIFQRYQHNKDLKMTKQEIKEEYKQQEGDPQLKSKIKQKQREMASRRMMQSIPEATVVVTNPTHFAVALRYEDGRDKAPTVVAKGQDAVALKIKEIARENEVPIIENKPLARLLFSEVEIDEEIPADMYQAVAEILATVMKLNKKR